MTTPKGFLFSGVHAGIKPFKKDLALVFSEAPCSAAAVLSINRARAAPLQDLAARLPADGIRAVLINSGIANAFTGEGGRADVEVLCAATAQSIDVPPSAVVMTSTGIIGQRLPVKKLLAALAPLAAARSVAPEAAAEAILTTDTHIKLASRTLALDGVEGRLFGICKGSGMTAPQLATVIAVVCTDIAISPECLQAALVGAMDGSFNNLNIDNDMSPNDTVLALANGLSGAMRIAGPGEALQAFSAQLRSLCAELAKEVARDGEGATKLVEVRVLGAPDVRSGGDIARAVAGSTLVKTALFGADPNWGRILATVGARSGSQNYPIEPEEARLSIQDILVYDRGPTLEDAGAADGSARPSLRDRVRARMRAPEVVVEIDLRAGSDVAVAWGCDLSYDYVKLNADYSAVLLQMPDGSVGKDERLTNYTPKFKVTLLTQALSYIGRFADKRVVLKLGRQAMGKESLRLAIVEDVRLLRSVGMVPILVHGESPDWPSHGDERSAQMMISGQTNLELVTLLNRSGVQAIGLAGMDASFLKGTRPTEGRSGTVVSVNGDVLEMFLQRHYVPVVAAVGIVDDGGTTLLDSDQTAAQIAGAIKAEKLVFLAGVPGFTENDELLVKVSTHRLRELLDAGAFGANMARKARSALQALDAGVSQVHLIDARSPHSIMAEFFTDQGIGSLVANA